MAVKFQAPDAKDDRDRLHHFLDATHAFFDELIQEGKDGHGTALFVPDMAPLIQASWNDLAHQFQEVHRGVESEWGEKLDEAGLTGNQLALKLGVVERLHARYESMGGHNALERVLDAIGNLLDSIVKATRVGEALKEFKEAVKLSIAGAEE